MKTDWHLPAKHLPCQSKSTDSKLALFLCFVATALLAALFRSKSTKRRDGDDVRPENWTLVLDFFKRLDGRTADDVRRKNLGTAIRYLDRLITEQSIRPRETEATRDSRDRPGPGTRVQMVEAAMLALKVYPRRDRLVCAAFTLLTLVVVRGNDDIRRTLREDPNDDGIEFFIEIMRDSLNRAKMEEDPPEDEERLSAEIQRRGCLFLGAFDDVDASAKIIELGGLRVIADAMQWYRFHAGVCKWALWAVFHLCYDRPKHQSSFVRIRGVQSVCQCIKNNAACADVTRHGIAILFDIMRDTAQNAEISTRARMIAFREGLIDLLIESMDNFPKDVEIRMMCQQMLGTAETFTPDKNLDIH